MYVPVGLQQAAHGWFALCQEHRCVETDGNGNGNACPEETLPGMTVCVFHCCVICCYYAFENVRPDMVKSLNRVQQSQFCKEHKCSVFNCMNERILDEVDQAFCAVHACSECDGVSKRVDEAMPESGLCPQNRCTHWDAAFGPCGLPRDVWSMFCSNHTCRVCIEEGLPLDRMVDQAPPRNVCDVHPLCCAVFHNGGSSNERVSLANFQYCDRHVDFEFQALAAPDGGKEQPSGTTKKGKRCKVEGYPLRMILDTTAVPTSIRRRMLLLKSKRAARKTMMDAMQTALLKLLMKSRTCRRSKRCNAAGRRRKEGDAKQLPVWPKALPSSASPTRTRNQPFVQNNARVRRRKGKGASLLGFQVMILRSIAKLMCASGTKMCLHRLTIRSLNRSSPRLKLSIRMALEGNSRMIPATLARAMKITLQQLSIKTNLQLRPLIRA